MDTIKGGSYPFDHLEWVGASEGTWRLVKGRMYAMPHAQVEAALKSGFWKRPGPATKPRKTKPEMTTEE